MFGIGCDRRIRTAAGLLRADEITAGLPKRAWQRLSAGAGAKGQRFYDWALIAHPDPAGTEDNPAGTECWWLLVRRHRHTGEPAFYRCDSPEPVPLRELVRVAGRRWTVEESFQAGRAWPGSTNTRSAAGSPGSAGPCSPWPHMPCSPSSPPTNTAFRQHRTGWLTCNEIRCLFVRFVIEPSRALACPQAWSQWRRRHQHRSRTSHYQRRDDLQPWT